MDEPRLRDLLDVAMEAAYRAGRRTLAYFQTGVQAERKPDNTPVTVADRESEAILRRHILTAFPEHGVLGEEDGETAGVVPIRWIVDPIDGTKSFVAGVPLYSVLVGIEVRGEPRVGVIYLPALDEMIAAADGLGCTWNGRPCRVSTVDALDQATLLTSSVTAAQARSNAWDRLAGATRMQRTWGDAYGYALVATGRAEIMLDPVISVWDCACLPPILREAGGSFTDWRGAESIWSREGAATNAVLHETVLGILRSERRIP